MEPLEKTRVSSDRILELDTRIWEWVGIFVSWWIWSLMDIAGIDGDVNDNSVVFPSRSFVMNW